MRKFTERDPDRQWSQKELGTLSQKDLTYLAILRNLKNVIFFAVGAIAVAYFAAGLGTIGIIIGWTAIVVLCLFALEPLWSFLLTIISLLGPVPAKGWMLVQLVVAAMTALIYVLLAALIYLKMKGMV